MSARHHNPLPGFHLTMGCTIFWLSLVVLLPIAALVWAVVAPAHFDLRHGDLRHADALVEDLRDLKAPHIVHFRSMLSAETLGAVDGFVSGPAKVVPAELTKRLLAELDKALADPRLADTNAFREANLGARTRDQMQQLPPKKVDRSLNRRLLEESFPGIFRPVTPRFADFWLAATNAQAMAAYRLSLWTSFAAAMVNAVFGTLLAWVLVRYDFPARRLLDAAVDFPFALPTAVAGLTLGNLFSQNGWIGTWLVPLGFKFVGTTQGIIVALTFVGLPFVVRTLQPVLETVDRDVEEAAATLGASRLRTFFSVIVPVLLPTIITGFAMAFARAIGEFGSVVFIASNKPFVGEVAPFLTYSYLEQHEDVKAIGVALVLLALSLGLLVSINLLERWASRFQR